MKNNERFAIVGIFLLAAFSFKILKEDDWGFFAHKRINRLAITTLPQDLTVFYKKNIEFITEHATDPDKRRYAVAPEGPRHFIDMDHWGKPPFPDLPRKFVDAMSLHAEMYVVDNQDDTIKLYSKENVTFQGKNNIIIKSKGVKKVFKMDSLTLSIFEYRRFFLNNVMDKFYADQALEVKPDSFAFFLKKQGLSLPFCKNVFVKDKFSEFGIVPYHLQTMQNRLTKAFKERDIYKVLRLSAEIGHYIGDAHVPLHTTENYNGQLTNQAGIHGFWESRLPELFADAEYDFFVGKAVYIDNFESAVWNTVLASHACLDSVFGIEKNLTLTFPRDQQLCFDERLGVTVKTQCRDFSRAYHTRLQGQVEDRMRAAILMVGSAWVTAWVDAGQPDMRNFGVYEETEADKKTNAELNNAAQNQTFKGREHEH